MYVNAHQLVLDRSTALDIFKGLLVCLMHSMNVILFLGTPNLRSESLTARMIANLGGAMCFSGFMAAFGYSSYRQYLREWPDPPKDVSRVRMRVLQAVALPIVGAWICNFAWCFLSAKQDAAVSARLVFDVFTFASVFGNGPDFLLGFSINLAVVYCLWRPIVNFINSVQPGSRYIDEMCPNFRRDATTLAIVMSPLLFTMFPLPDCTGYMRWAQWFTVCEKRDLDTPTLPALPHLVDFGLGILVAAAWDRFIAHLKPLGQGGEGETAGLHLLPMASLRQWGVAIMAGCKILLLLFIPLGQVWLYTDFAHVHLQTPVGVLSRGYSGGPSCLWLLATIWPLAALSVFACILVILKGGPLRPVLELPLVWLEHLGANVLYYLIVVNLFLAGMSHTQDKSGKNGIDTKSCIMTTVFILIFCRFLHFAAQAARK